MRKSAALIGMQRALLVRGLRARHRNGASCVRGTGAVPVEPQVFDLLALPDPESRARRQQGRPCRVGVAGAHGVGIRLEHPDQRRPLRPRPTMGRTTADQDPGAKGRAICRSRSRGARHRRRRADASFLPAAPTSRRLRSCRLQNLGGDPEQDYFADGIVEEITTALSRNRAILRRRPQLVVHLQGEAGQLPTGGARTWRPLFA